MNGFSFVFGRRHYKGSQLRCSWASLREKINYSEKDNEFLFSLVPEDKHPAATPTAEPPRRQYCIYSLREWKKMGGEKQSDYRRAYRMINSGYSLRDVAAELRLQNPSMSDKKIEKILMSTGKYWIQNNQDRLNWAYNSRKRYIRFSNDPAVMLIEVLALLVSTAIRASIKNIEKHQTAKRIDGISQELKDMANYAENRALQRREQAYEREERERENPLLAHAREISAEMSR